MNIQIIGMDKPIQASDIIQAILRTDLIPIPSSFEFSFLQNDELRQHLKLDSLMTIGSSKMEYKVIKLTPVNTDLIKDGQIVGAIAGVAIPVGLETLLTATNKAVILRDTSFNAVYRALGARISLNQQDTPIPYFVCMKGMLPTERIAEYMQREATMICLKNDRLTAVKIDDLFRQDVKYQFESSAMNRVESQVAQNNEKVNVVSMDKDGSTAIYGKELSDVQIIQRGNLSSREISNMAKVLMIQGTIVRPLLDELQAGDLVTVADEKMVILTSAHIFKSDGFGQGSVMMSKFWLGKVG